MERKKNTHTKEYKIRVGEMPVVSGKVKPNKDKGELRFFYNPDNMLCLQWVNIENDSFNEPLVIFGGEWEWLRQETSKGRVYVLQSKTFPEEKYFFWMQYPNISDDSLNEKIINNILESGNLEVEDEKNEKEQTSVDIIMKNEENSSGSHQNKSNNKNNSNFIKNLAQSLNKNSRKFDKLFRKISFFRKNSY